MTRQICLFVLVALAACAGRTATGQSFTNLNFESPAQDFTFNLPGWTISEHVQGPHLGVAHLLYSAPAPTEWNPSPFPFPAPFPIPVTNHYSLAMQVGFHYEDPSYTEEIVDAPRISQTGLIPAGTQSIRLRSSGPDPFHYHYLHGPAQRDADVYPPALSVAWQMEIDGRPYPLYRLGDDWFGMNVPGHAGQVRTLSISMNDDYYLNLMGVYWPESMFDDITFSPARIVPEPAAASLVAMGTILVWSSRRKRAPLARRG